MAYTKTTWVDGSTALSAEHMNNIETGIEDAHIALADKVDKVEGKGLSTNDYTTEEKNKLASLSSVTTKIVNFRTASGMDEPYSAGSNTIDFEALNDASSLSSTKTILTGVAGVAGHSIRISDVKFKQSGVDAQITFYSKTSGAINPGDYIGLICILG